MEQGDHCDNIVVYPGEDMQPKLVIKAVEVLEQLLLTFVNFGGGQPHFAHVVPTTAKLTSLGTPIALHSVE